MRLPVQHTTHLLNALHSEGVTSVSVSHPCQDISELFQIDITEPTNTVVRFSQGALAYQDTLEDLRTKYDEQAYNDLPGKETYIRALVAGSLVDIENSDKVETFFRQHGHPDLDAGHEPVALGVDTNLLAWRIIDALELDPERYSDDKGRSPVNGFALAIASTVQVNGVGVRTIQNTLEILALIE